MDGLERHENPDTLHRSVEGVEADLEAYHGNEYVIRGLQLGDGFGIGLSFASGGSPPEDIVPLEVYETVEETLRAQIDIEAVQRQTTPDVWPHLGTCNISVRHDESVSVEIDICDLGTIRS